MTTALLAAAVFVPTFAGLRGWRVRLPWRVTVRVVRVRSEGVTGDLRGLGRSGGYRDVQDAAGRTEAITATTRGSK